VIKADNGEDAIRLAKNEKPDLTVLDIAGCPPRPLAIIKALLGFLST
jgi:Ni,Fe-hydrogenase III small subunit